MTFDTKDNFNNVSFKVTNEDLELIIRGMQPKQEQRFLSIYGSGDVPFALSEFGEVVAFDIDANQIEYAKFRKKALIERDYNNFFNPNHRLTGFELDTRKYQQKTYLTDEKLKQLKPERVRFIHSDGRFLDLNELFDSIYLSNMIGYKGDKDEGKPEYTQKLSQSLQAVGHFASD